MQQFRETSSDVLDRHCHTSHLMQTVGGHIYAAI